MATVPTTYVSVTDTAKQVRAMLKAEFPGVKFSVRSDSYAGGASIRVAWLDGPTDAMVQAKIGHFAGASFDGMIDLKSYHTTLVAMPDGTTAEVHFGADYVFTNRSLTPEFRSALELAYRETWGQDYVLHADFYADRQFHKIAAETPGPTHKIAKMKGAW